MKTAKSIIVVLFVLLTTQIASAFYCPSTGRWLSRDPVDELGFHELQAASVVWPVRRPFHPPPVRWIKRDGTVKNDGVSLYGFVENDSVNELDLLGLMGLPIDPDSVSQGIWNAIRAGDWDAAASAIEDAAGVLPENVSQALSCGLNMMKYLDKWRKQMGKLCGKDKKAMLEKFKDTLADHMSRQKGIDSGETMKIRYQIDFLKKLIE